MRVAEPDSRDSIAHPVARVGENGLAADVAAPVEFYYAAGIQGLLDRVEPGSDTFKVYRSRDALENAFVIDDRPAGRRDDFRRRARPTAPR